MIHDAKVEVTCDGPPSCKASEFIDLHAGARSTYIYDEKAINKELKSLGWTVIDGAHYCENCAPSE